VSKLVEPINFPEDDAKIRAVFKKLSS
jgi:Ca2+-binding EF-hand superfamily protein